MSSFYGNIKFNNQTPFIFDKIYSSRRDMENQCHSDGIFHGRYVLVSYGDIRYTPYHKIGRLLQSVFNGLIDAGNILYVAATEDGVSYFKAVTKEEYYSDNEYYVKTEYALDDTSVFARNKSLDEQNYHHEYHNTVWQKIWTSTQDSDQIQEKYIMVSHLNAETPKLTVIVDAPNDSMDNDPNNIGYFLVPTDQLDLNVPGRITEEDFINNKSQLFILDDNEFKPVSSSDNWNILTDYYVEINTVKRKVVDSKPYVDGMISQGLYEDLINNRNIPLYTRNGNSYNLASSWNRTQKYYFLRSRDNQGRPHFDPIMSTDLEYLLHLPRNWKISNSTTFDYNKAGFNPEKVSHTGTEDNSIVLDEVSSGSFYPVHRADAPEAGLYDENKNLVTAEQPDTKKFNINLRKLGDAVSEMWDTVYPHLPQNPNTGEIFRDTYIGNDRLRPENDQENYPETVAEAVRKLYYWLGLNEDLERGIKGDNNFKYGPWIDPNTGEEVDTIFGVLNGASDLLGTFEDTFNNNLFIPVASPYYPDGYNHLITDEGFSGLSETEFTTLHLGGAGPLYVKVGINQYNHATSYDENTQYYRNMNSLLSILKAWQECVKNKQGDWIVEINENWSESNPSDPRYIHNKPIVLGVDPTQRAQGGLYSIPDMTETKFNELKEKGIEIYASFYWESGTQVVYYENIRNPDGTSTTVQRTEIRWSPRTAQVQVNHCNYPPNFNQAMAGQPIVGQIRGARLINDSYKEKHISPEGTINWYWYNYAI